MIFYYLDVDLTSYWLEWKWVDIVCSPGDVNEEKVRVKKFLTIFLQFSWTILSPVHLVVKWMG